MKTLKRFLFAFLICFSLPLAVIHAQNDQSGFISIDCGLPEGSDYEDESSGIYYISDTSYTQSGVVNTILPSYQTNSLSKHYVTLRSFPDGTRNCYTLKPSQGKGNKYLIRASFLYGNYDTKTQLPTFKLQLGVDDWDTVEFDDASTPVRKEIIHIPTSDNIHVCLVKTGLSTPFISTLELRVLNNTNSMYTSSSGSLQLVARVSLYNSSSILIRYKNDKYDRIWNGFVLTNTTTLQTNSQIAQRDYQLPTLVMNTPSTPNDARTPLSFYWDAKNISDKFYVYMHFAEVIALQPNQSREFDIFINDDKWYGPYRPYYLISDTIYSRIPSNGSLRYQVSINRTGSSTLPPILNALEIYSAKEFLHMGTNDTDVSAVLSIKSTYELKRDWQGDPCSPQAFVWESLSCSYDGFESPRIISLNLSSSGLNGVVSPYISNLTELQTLDLSGNNLTGPVPDFLTQLAKLRALNLKGNNFTGLIPAQLLEKRNNGLLSLSFDGPESTNSCESVPCEKKNNNNIIIPAVASAGALAFVILSALLIFCIIKRRKKSVSTQGDVHVEPNKKEGLLEAKNRQFTYSEVLSITNNFQRVIGKGGFGTVYHGYVGETQVAVKMLSQSSTQGYKEFQAEAKILMNIHHKNLCSLVGYCHEGTNMGIIYEYMSNGNLDQHLLDRNLYVLSWEERLRIAMDAAQGLEYLHHGCKPPIAHRDVKCTNILLNENFHAKLADFGLSRVFPVEGGTHVSTVIAGTPGYLDPEYYTSNRLTEKSDVYGFGVVLLEIITGRQAIARTHDRTHLIQWVSSILPKGDVKLIIDAKLRGEFDVNSAWKVVELAMACVARNSSDRPNMNHVVMELKQCLEDDLETPEMESKNSIGMMSMSMESELGPLAR